MEKMPNNDKYYIVHHKETNTFCLRLGKKQEEKDDLFQLIFNLEKIAKSKDKAEIARLKRVKAEAKQDFKDLREEYVQI